jgi:hypothetical protein
MPETVITYQALSAKPAIFENPAAKDVRAMLPVGRNYLTGGSVRPPAGPYQTSERAVHK